MDASRGDLKKQIADVIKPLAMMYRFQTFGEYRALLSLYNIGVEKVEGDNKGHRYAGLVYSSLDTDGNRIGKPLKSSLFGKSYGIEALEQAMKKSGEEIKAEGRGAKTKALVSASLMASHNGGEFRADLREKGIDLILRYGNGGRLFGATFIDHNSRTVLNGSSLGKEFSANALSARFADFSQPGREDLQPATPDVLYKDQRQEIKSDPALSRNDRPQTTQPYHDNRPPEPFNGHSGNNSLVGGLLSILTPEPDPRNDNQSVPKRRKKKKRKYGRQV